jgi:hypothetical protein
MGIPPHRWTLFALAALFLLTPTSLTAGTIEKDFAAAINDCGLSGSVKERIRDCLEQNPETRSGRVRLKTALEDLEWSLVTSDPEHGLFFRDDRTGVIWSPPLAKGGEMAFTSQEAGRICDELPFLGRHWSVPAGFHYSHPESGLGAEQHGIREVLQMTCSDHSYWHASEGWAFGGADGILWAYSGTLPLLLRCITVGPPS